jgi:glycosyltransferase involved in cell wall biosynthesis
MKILHVAYSLDDNSAGTRLAKIQDKLGEKVHFLVGRKSSSAFVSQYKVHRLVTNSIGYLFHLIDFIYQKLFLQMKGEIFSFGVYNFSILPLIKQVVNQHNIEVIHLHWGGYSFLSHQVIIKIRQQFPQVKIIITAHDYYYATGGCHIPMDCIQYEKECKCCPMLKPDRQAWMHSRILEKMAIMTEVNPVVVCPSSYVQSVFHKRYPQIPLYVVPNILPDQYFNFNLEGLVYFNTFLNYRNQLRDIPTFITVGVKSSERQNKGADIFIEVFGILKKHAFKANLITVGEYLEIPLLGTRFHYDSISNDRLVELFQISDLTLVTSRYETFSQVALESLILGTPVVAFDLTGPKDILSNSTSGFLVKAFNVDQFATTMMANSSYKHQHLDEILADIKNLREVYNPDQLTQQHLSIYQNG